MRHARWATTVPLIIGVAVGIALPSLSLGIASTHLGCSQPSVAGWSGMLAAPLAVGVPPPGGLMNLSYQLTTATGPGSSSGTIGVPVNSTRAALQLVNWTLFAESPVTEPGRGPNLVCTQPVLVPTTNGGGCFGCVLAPGVAGGVGVRSVLPTQGSWDPYLTPILNGSYPASPVAAFDWNISGGQIYINFSEGGSQFLRDAVAYQSYPGAPYSGLELHLRETEVGFGVPIHLLNGGTTIVPSGTPQWLAGSSLLVDLNYIFPGVGDNRTWNVYPAGGGSPFPLGGLLFMETN